MMQMKLLQFTKFAFSLLMIVGVASSDPPESPCPELFQYKFDGSDWIGLIELNNIKVNQTVINIIVEFSMPTPLPSPYKGRLGLLEEQEEASQAVFESKPLFYKVNFPLKNPIPKVTQIVVDNNELCSGPPAGNTPTRFQLHHVFYPKRPSHPNMTEETSIEGRPCKLTDGSAGVCTITNKCMEVFKGSIKYAELIKIRCGFVDGTDVVCCKDPDPPTGQRADEACAKYEAEMRLPIPYEDKIKVTQDDFPHMAVLGYEHDQGKFTGKCGASLISHQYLLTSAHCLRQNKVISKARFGSYEYYGINEKIIHPNYKDHSLYHDVALVKLDAKVDFTKKLHTACLDTKQTHLPPETNILLVKWLTSDIYQNWFLTLTTKYLKVTEFSSCSQSYANNRKLPNGLTQGQMCASDPELKEGCEEDSDGMLQIVDNNGKHTIYGMTNFLGGCAFSLPGVYTRFSNYIDWIESIVWPYTPI